MRIIRLLFEGWKMSSVNHPCDQVRYNHILPFSGNKRSAAQQSASILIGLNPIFAVLNELNNEENVTLMSTPEQAGFTDQP